MFYELFVFGTFWFWLFLAAEIIWLLSCAARDSVGWQWIVSVFLFLGILQCFSDVNVFLFIWHNPFLVFLLLGLYLLGGCIWVFPKWWFFCKDHLRKYIDLRDEFLRSRNIEGSVVPQELKEAWKDRYVANNTYHEDRIVFKPEPKLYKNRIVTWMVLWPMSFLLTMLNDPITRFFQYIYHEIIGVLRKISDNVFEEVKNDMKEDA
jgi:hypothetical protein